MKSNCLIINFSEWDCITEGNLLTFEEVGRVFRNACTQLAGGDPDPIFRKEGLCKRLSDGTLRSELMGTYFYARENGAAATRIERLIEEEEEAHFVYEKDPANDPDDWELYDYEQAARELGLIVDDD